MLPCLPCSIVWNGARIRRASCVRLGLDWSVSCHGKHLARSMHLFIPVEVSRP
jgi:hypothetical protein